MEQSVQAMFNLYLSRSDLRPASVDTKRRACQWFIRWFGDMPVGNVTAATALDYRTMLSRGRKVGSVNGYLNNFRSFWSWLHKHGYIVVNPFGFVGPLKVDEEPPRDTFTPQELSRVMAVATTLEQIQVCFGLLGCRRGEMQAIQIRDVRFDDPDGPHVLLKKKDNNKKTLSWGAKGHKARYIGIPVTMAFDGRVIGLHKLLAERIDELSKDPDAYLCVDSRHIQKRLAGERDWDALRDLQGNHPRSFKALQRRAGIDDFKRFHELRSAFVTTMLDSGMDSARVAEIVGHASVQQTRKYDRRKRLSLVTEAAKVVSTAYLTRAS
jgi:site-specific recombinase XerD